MTPPRAVARLLLGAALLPSCGLLSSLGGPSEEAAKPPPAQLAAVPSENLAGIDSSNQGTATSEEVEALRAELETLREESARRVAEAEAREYDLRLEFDRVRGQLAAWQQERPPVPWTLWLAGASLLAAFLAILSSWQASRSAARLRRLVESLEVEVVAAPMTAGPVGAATVPARPPASEPAAAPDTQSASPRPAARLRKRPPVG